MIKIRTYFIVAILFISIVNFANPAGLNPRAGKLVFLSFSNMNFEKVTFIT